MATLTDTIVAQATPPGRGSVAILRVSGPLVKTIAREVLATLPRARQARYLSFRDRQGAAIDQGLALYFPAPHSYTGEDTLELHGHGSPVLMDVLQRRILQLGARLARPGEFSERAFRNGKLDLAQAEAIADLIESGTEQAARAAQRSLQGEFSLRIDALIEQLVQLRMYVESALDFPEEEIDFLADRSVAQRLATLLTQLSATHQAARQGSLLREGITVVIAGRPNVGKSSLLNRLAGRAAAIVTAHPGTTRDVLREHIQLDGLPLHLMDTAGLRESEEPVEQEGIRRARAEIAQADRILLLIDHQEGLREDDRALMEQLAIPVTLVRNKIDVSLTEPALRRISPMEKLGEIPEILISAKTGAGIDLLRGHLQERAGYQDAAEGCFSARRRHLDALRRAQTYLENGQGQLRNQRAGELLAEDLKLAQHALSEITGAYTTDDLLGKIFSSFCIGK